MSWVSEWVQFSRQPVMPTLNLRGRFVKALFPTNIAVKSRATGEASSSSFGVRPNAGQPMMLRMLSMPVCSVTSPTVEQPVQDLRHVLDAEPAQLHLLPRGDVDQPRPMRLARSPMARSWPAVVTPFGMRSRIMK